MREIVFDTETTRLDPLTGDRMVEIGCVELVNRVATGRVFHAYYNPERAMPAEAEKVHGLSDMFLSDKPLFRESVADLLEFIAEDPLVAHNAQFDFGFLNHELGLCGFAALGDHRMVDTLVLARKRHPGAKHSLDQLCTRYGVDRSHREKHGALLDAELLAQVYVELCGGRQIGLGLVEETHDNVVQPAAFRPKTGTFRPARPHQPSVEELARHRQFLESMDTPIWNS